MRPKVFIFPPGALNVVNRTVAGTRRDKRLQLSYENVFFTAVRGAEIESLVQIGL